MTENLPSPKFQLGQAVKIADEDKRKSFISSFNPTWLVIAGIGRQVDTGKFKYFVANPVFSGIYDENELVEDLN